jgi:tetratricopeptide (TPR) repeat protein/predicted Ser/Thr protein kinase
MNSGRMKATQVTEARTVFISHSKEDANTAKQISRQLAVLGYSTSCSEDYSRSGPQWTKAVAEAISSSSLLILIWSRHSVQSHFVEFEYTKAAALGRPVLPCLLDDAPLAAPLSAVAAVQFRNADEGISRLIEAMGSLGLPVDRKPENNGIATAPAWQSQGAADVGTLLGSGATQTVIRPVSGDTGDAGERTRPIEGAFPNLGARYRVIKMLGRGGMGAVYHAYDTELDRDVALKVIRGELADDPALLKRFKREIQLSSTITHKNVLRVYDLGEKDGTRFLTMQYVQGEDLGTLLKREGKLSVVRLFHIFRQICLGLAAAHERGVLHRDLKPANVMIDKDDQVYLTDFGLARSVTQSGLTQAGDVIGTPHYMSPEQVKGERTDTRSDIYSLGVILYEMATGDVPYHGDTIYEVMIQRVQKAPRPATELNPDIPPFLGNVIKRCMAIDKAARYTSVEELLNDLNQGVETGHTLVAGKYYLRRWRELVATLRWRRFAAAAPVILLIVLAGWWLWKRGTPAAIVAHPPVLVLVADFDNQTGEPQFAGALESTIETALEGASFVTIFDRNQARRIAEQLKQGTRALKEDLARLVATREGINVVVQGVISSRNSRYEVSVSAVDSLTGNRVASANAAASKKEDVLLSLGKLSTRIRTKLGDTTPESVQMQAAETFTSSSLEAARAYAAAQGLQGEGKWEDAIASYNNAIQLDPGLGRAYAGLAVMYRNLGRRDEAEKEYRLALQHIDRMTEREKYKTRGGYFLVVGNYPKAIEELTNLIQHYPADFAGHTNLALAYFYTRRMKEALEAQRRATAIYPKNVVMRSNVALFAMYAGDFKASADMERQLLKTEKPYWRMYVCLALSELAQGHSAEAAEAYRNLAGLGPSAASTASLGLADIVLFQGRYADAAEILKQGIAADRQNKDVAAAVRKSVALALADLSLNQTSQALAGVGQIVSESKQPSILYEISRVYIGAGRQDKAQDIATELGKSIREEPRAYGKLIEAEVRLSRGDVWEAVRLFHESQGLTDTWLGRYGLGRAYIQGSAYTEADSELEQCINRRGEAAAVFLDDMPSLWYLPPVYYYLGRAQQGLGSPAAAESYRTFLSMRGQASQDPLVVDAQRRAASY